VGWLLPLGLESRAQLLLGGRGRREASGPHLQAGILNQPRVT
jgi:hypothetical protein